MAKLGAFCLLQLLVSMTTCVNSTWIISDLGIHIQIDPPSRMYSASQRAPLTLRQSFTLDVNTTLTKPTDFNITKSIPRDCKVLMNIEAGEGKLLKYGVQKSNTQDFDKVTGMLKVVKFPITIFFQMISHSNDWAYVPFPEEYNPFPLYMFPFAGFDSFWVYTLNFDLTLVDGVDIAYTMNKDLSFVLSVTNASLVGQGDVAFLGETASRYGYSPCVMDKQGSTALARCPWKSRRGEHTVARVVIRIPQMTSHIQKPESCQADMNPFSSSATIHTDITIGGVLGWLFTKKVILLTYIAIFAFGHGLLYLGQRLTNRNPNTVNMLHEAFLEVSFLCYMLLLGVVSVDTHSRQRLAACFLFYTGPQHAHMDFDDFIITLIWGIHPLILITLVLHPFRSIGDLFLKSASKQEPSAATDSCSANEKCIEGQQEKGMPDVVILPALFGIENGELPPKVPPSPARADDTSGSPVTTDRLVFDYASNTPLLLTETKLDQNSLLNIPVKVDLPKHTKETVHSDFVDDTNVPSTRSKLSTLCNWLALSMHLLDFYAISFALVSATNMAWIGILPVGKIYVVLFEIAASGILLKLMNI